MTSAGRSWTRRSDVRARRAVVFGSAVALSASARRARHRTVGREEAGVFRAVNGAPDAIHPPVWLLMQSGSLGAVFVVSGLLHRRGRARTAAMALATGTAVWAGAKVVKPFVGRGRPAHYLDDARVRGAPQSGLGYPSGHAAVSMVLALIASDGCPVGVRRTAVGIAVATGLARVYVGAHLPLDIVGGSALGVIVGLTATDVGGTLGT